MHTAGTLQAREDLISDRTQRFLYTATPACFKILLCYTVQRVTYLRTFSEIQLILFFCLHSHLSCHVLGHLQYSILSGSLPAAGFACRLSPTGSKCGHENNFYQFVSQENLLFRKLAVTPYLSKPKYLRLCMCLQITPKLQPISSVCSQRSYRYLTVYLTAWCYTKIVMKISHKTKILMV